MKDIPFLKERDSYENGINCLTMIFMYYGFENIRDQLRFYTQSYCSLATSLLGIKNTAQEMGFESNAFQFQNLNNNELPFEKDMLPAIVFCQDPGIKRKSFMIVYDISPTHVWLIDTIKGKTKLQLSEFYAMWYHILITVIPTDQSFKTSRYKKLQNQIIPKHVKQKNSTDFTIKNKANLIKEIDGNQQVSDVLIIGAGPSGIACGLEAEKSGLSYCILEKNDVLQALRNYPQHMQFVSEAEELKLDGLPFAENKKKITTQELLQYYENIVEDYNLRIQQNEHVQQIINLTHGFKVITRTHIYYALNIVIATGGDQSRTIDNVPGINSSKVSNSFTEAYNNPEKYYNTKVIIVGGGISAISLANKLCEYHAKVSIIHRNESLRWTTDSVIQFHFPNIPDYLNKGSLEIHYNSELIKVNDIEVTIKNNVTQEHLSFDNDYVFLMLGTIPSNRLLTNLKVNISDHCPFPILNPETLETSNEGIFVIGTASGQSFFRHFKEHAAKAIVEIQNRIHAESYSV